MRAAFERTWEESHESWSAVVHTGSHQVAQVERAAQVHEVRGICELHVEDEFHDHSIWYVDDFEAGGPGIRARTITQWTRAMTGEEEQANCG